jgi:hypothetical protein
MTLLRYWLLGTALVIGGLAIWAIAPVVIFLLLLTAALGVVSFGMVALANALRNRRERR